MLPDVPADGGAAVGRGARGVSAIVVEEAIAGRTPHDGSGALVVIPRARRRGSWRPLDPDLIVGVLEETRGDGVVAARPADADPGAASLPALGTIMGLPVVRLPADEAAAAATIALVARPGFGGADPGRGLAVLAVLAAEGIAVPSVRPAVLARWAARAWRPCDRCAAGGPAGVRCGACGARLAGGPE